MLEQAALFEVHEENMASQISSWKRETLFQNTVDIPL